jgi:hypothetical protein
LNTILVQCAERQIEWYGIPGKPMQNDLTLQQRHPRSALRQSHRKGHPVLILNSRVSDVEVVHAAVVIPQRLQQVISSFKITLKRIRDGVRVFLRSNAGHHLVSEIEVSRPIDPHAPAALHSDSVVLLEELRGLLVQTNIVIIIGSIHSAVHEVHLTTLRAVTDQNGIVVASDLDLGRDTMSEGTVSFELLPEVQGLFSNNGHLFLISKECELLKYVTA